jgi:predicted small lipoprotein YifL
MLKTLLRAGGLLAAGALVALVSGCGKKGPVLYPVKGSVRINGEPAKEVNVMFTPVTPIEGITELLSPAAVTEEDGSFRLMSFKPGDGAPAGDYQVTVIYPMNRFSKYLSGIDRLRGKFADPKTSGLTAKVEPKSNDLPPFDLKADVMPLQTHIDQRLRKKIREG